MPTTFFQHKQDPICTKQNEELKAKLDALGKVVEELSADNAKLREEMQTRFKVADDDLSAMESRLTARIEEIEDRVAGDADYSVNEEETPASGYVKPSVRKRQAAEAASDPTVWTKPRPVRPKPEAAPKE